MKKNKKSKKWLWILGIVLLVGIIGISVLSNQNNVADNIKTTTITRNQISLVSLSTGKITSNDQDNIRLSGTVSKVNVSLGDVVKKGDVLGEYTKTSSSSR